VNPKLVFIVIACVLTVAVAAFMGYKAFGPNGGDAITPTDTQPALNQDGVESPGVNVSEEFPAPPGWDADQAK